MTNTQRVKEHFDRKAGQYEHERKRGILGRMVLCEMRAAMKMLDVKKGERILDCGCGAGAYGKAIRNKGGKYLGIDISPRMIKEARRKGLDAKCCAIEDFHAREKFDKILISGSLEFCKEPGYAIKQCVKNLKKGGLLVIIAPRRNIPCLLYRSYHLLHRVKIRLFSRKNITDIMREAGFQEDRLAWSKPNPLVFILSGRKDFSS